VPKASNGDDAASEALATAIKREAMSYVAKTVIATAVGIIGIAALGLWIYVKQFLPQLAGGVPPGAVMAFDLPSGCPAGWGVFEEASGRTIVGATRGQSPPPNHDQNGQTLSFRTYRTTAGEERHLLNLDEMTPHVHGVQISEHPDYQRGVGGRGDAGAYNGAESVGRDARLADAQGTLRYTELYRSQIGLNRIRPWRTVFG
jgi:hypothetical protein